ncbi:MAG: undecaprenyl-phosphate glucose phosphotransferase [Candidatus Omnitrophica bacterium]|nr:undecaprenyl-phosphate glucose phosphotransferase [Candidatus Omnitrophota bacterium]
MNFQERTRLRIRNDVRIGVILMLGDIIAINAGILFSYWLRFNAGIFPVIKGVPHVSEYYGVLPLMTIILIFLMRSEKLYFVKARLSIVDEFFSITKSVSVGILIFMAGTFLYREYSFSRAMLLTAWAVLIGAIGSWRFLVNRVRITVRSRSEKKRNLLVIGDGAMVERLIGHVSDDPHWDYNVKGILRISEEPAGEVRGVKVIGGLKDCENALREMDIHEVILTEVNVSRDEVMDIILECDKYMVEFRVIADLLGMVTSQVDMRTIDGVPLLGLKETPLSEGYNRLVKRLMDIFVSGAGLVLLSPAFLVIAAAIKISSPGSVFYLQKRIGEDGRRFSMFKFRTMVEKAEKGTGPVWTVENDPRRTVLGAFLRKTNIDELPQLINVFKGEMSLVGPRPERPHFVGKFKEKVPRYMARHKIKSGMTGWAQVNGLRGNTSIEERTKYDLYYIENWSLGFDVKILFMSVFALKNAY